MVNWVCVVNYIHYLIFFHFLRRCVTHRAAPKTKLFLIEVTACVFFWIWIERLILILIERERKREMNGSQSPQKSNWHADPKNTKQIVDLLVSTMDPRTRNEIRT